MPFLDGGRAGTHARTDPHLGGFRPHREMFGDRRHIDAAGVGAQSSLIATNMVSGDQKITRVKK